MKNTSLLSRRSVQWYTSGTPVHLKLGLVHKLEQNDVVKLHYYATINWKGKKHMTLISDSQIIVALVSAFITGILALRLGKELYK